MVCGTGIGVGTEFGTCCCVCNGVGMGLGSIGAMCGTSIGDAGLGMGCVVPVYSAPILLGRGGVCCTMLWLLRLCCVL